MGCASTKGLEVAQPQYSRGYKAGFEETWQGAMKTLEELGIDIKEAKKDTGEIETNWFYREGEQAMSILHRGYWKERYEVFLTLAPRGDTTVVNIRSRAEEKAPGGTQAYKWTRKASTGEVEEFLLTEIGKTLASKEEK
ncbi:MAG TPA: hypothetical protein ACFYD3_05540 [Candidatus Hypogeohydataceae bacterium YC41]